MSDDEGDNATFIRTRPMGNRGESQETHGPCAVVTPTMSGPPPSWQEVLRQRLVARNTRDASYATIIEQCKHHNPFSSRSPSPRQAACTADKGPQRTKRISPPRRWHRPLQPKRLHGARRHRRRGVRPCFSIQPPLTIDPQQPSPRCIHRFSRVPDLVPQRRAGLCLQDAEPELAKTHCDE